MKRTGKMIALALTATAILATGCTGNKGESKEAFIQALAKQSEVKQYTYAGTADLDIGLTAPAATSKDATAGLISMFSKSKWSWTGATQENPYRMEGSYTLAAGDASFTFPLIYKDDLLYLSIPLLSKQDEYYSFDLKKQNAASPGTGLQGVNSAVSGALTTIVTDFEEGWFKKTKEPVKLKDGTEATLLRVEITEKNRNAITEKAKQQLGAVIDKWSTQGLLPAQQATQLKGENAKRFALKAGELSVAVDASGFIREQTIKLDYSADGSETAEQQRHFYYSQAFDGINQAPEFKLDVPKNVKPFDDVMKMLNNK